LASAPSPFRIESQGYADNISFFTNVAFGRAGRFSVQTFLNGQLITEKHLFVHLIQQAPTTVN
jgi:hypothetical protein